ncbi:MAG: T9SS type A sorting domain-containing protein, partial [Panacibacter sp.]
LIGSLKQLIAVYPNPVKDGIINLQMLNQPKGVYEIKLLNNQGQSVLTKNIQYGGGSSTEKIEIEKRIAKGIYTLQITRTKDKMVIDGDQRKYNSTVVLFL